MKKYFLIIITVVIFGLGILFFSPKNSQPGSISPVSDNAPLSAEPDEPINSENNSALPEKVLLPNPNHVFQTFNNCGPATLSMALGFYGINATQEELALALRPFQHPKGDNDDKNIFSFEMVGLAEKHGLKALSRVNGDIDLLKSLTAHNIPVITKTWLNDNEDIGHFRLVRGYDSKKEQIIQDDSYQGKNKKYSYVEFLKIWQAFNYNYIILYKQDQEELVKSILKDEFDEIKAWESALVRAKQEEVADRDNIYPIFNQSAIYYRLGNYEKSVQSFEAVRHMLPKRMLWYQIEPLLSYFYLEKYSEVFFISDLILNSGNRAFSELYIIRAEIYKKQGRSAEAEQEMQKASYYNPKSQTAFELL